MDLQMEDVSGRSNANSQFSEINSTTATGKDDTTAAKETVSQIPRRILRRMFHHNETTHLLSKHDVKSRIPARIWLIVLGFLSLFHAFAIRAGLSVAIVAMVNHTAIGRHGNNFTDECRLGNISNEDSKDEIEGSFDWDEQTQGLILGSFFWGYLIMQIPGGRLAELWSAKWLFGGGMLWSAVLTLLLPVAATGGWHLFTTIRALQGFGEGVTFPALHVLIAKWSPPMERGRTVGLSYLGVQIGTISGTFIAGFLCKYGFAGGWPSVFYVFGISFILWFFLWSFMIFESPSQHPRISKEERDFIIASIGETTNRKTHPPVPWRRLLLSPATWAIIIATVGQNWGFYTILTEMPSYLKYVFHFDIKQNGLISSLPYIGMSFMGISSSFIGDKLQQKGICSTTVVRKLFTSIAQFSAATFLLVVPFTGCDQLLPILGLILAITFLGNVYAGFRVNHIDISPKFAGTILGIANTIGCIPGWLAPFSAGIITQEEQTRKQWGYVFFLASGILFFTGTIYLLFSSGEEQSWSREAKETLQQPNEEAAHPVSRDRARTLTTN